MLEDGEYPAEARDPDAAAAAIDDLSSSSLAEASPAPSAPAPALGRRSTAASSLFGATGATARDDGDGGSTASEGVAMGGSSMVGVPASNDTKSKGLSSSGGASAVAASEPPNSPLGAAPSEGTSDGVAAATPNNSAETATAPAAVVAKSPVPRRSVRFQEIGRAHV